MREIELQPGGRLMAIVEIPPYVDSAMPDVVAWGDRVFQKTGATCGGRAVYREAFAVVSFTPSPGIPQE